jgi:hypothetical protein
VCVFCSVLKSTKVKSIRENLLRGRTPPHCTLCPVSACCWSPQWPAGTSHQARRYPLEPISVSRRCAQLSCACVGSRGVRCTTTRMCLQEERLINALSSVHSIAAFPHAPHCLAHTHSQTQATHVEVLARSLCSHSLNHWSLRLTRVPLAGDMTGVEFMSSLHVGSLPSLPRSPLHALGTPNSQTESEEPTDSPEITPSARLGALM